MKIPAIKQAVEKYSLTQLQQAEEALLNEEKINIEISGDDDGEKLTHIMGAIYTKEQIEKGIEPNKAIRAFIDRVRNSIN
jgi:hypothetical protein